MAYGGSGIAPRQTSASSRRLLLVEDDELDARLVEEWLSDTGDHQSLVHVDSLASAQSSLARQEFDAVLLDLGLPDGDGVECVQSIRKLAPMLPIVVLTGRSDAALGMRCVSLGAQDYLPKNDLQPSSLRRAIDYACIRVKERAERRRANALQGRLASVVEASNDAILTLTREGTVTSWNTGAERMLGVSAERAIGRPLQASVSPPEVGDRVLPWSELLAREGSLFEARVARADGAVVDVSMVSSAVPGTDGFDEGIATILRDMTVAKLQAKQLQERYMQLEQRDQQMRALTERLNTAREEERTRISRTVHDELGQLLTGLKLDLRWMSKRLARTPHSDEVAQVVVRIRAAEELVDETVSTVQRIAVELRPSALDSLGLTAAVRDEVRRFRHRTGTAAEVLVVASREPDPARATVLFRVLQELLTNVARHSEASWVRVELRAGATGWQLQVCDDGVGIPPEGQRGTALGLLGVRERVESMGGEFAIGARHGAGTTATVLLPENERSGLQATEATEQVKR